MDREERELEIKRLGIEVAKLRLEALTLTFEKAKQDRVDYNHMSRVTADYALNAIRTIVIINGGATISLLAFLGAFAKTGNRLEGIDFKIIVRSLCWFASGTGMAALTVASGYIARVVRGRHKSLAYHAFTVVGILVGLASVAAFFYGVKSMPEAFAHAKAKDLTETHADRAREPSSADGAKTGH